MDRLFQSFSQADASISRRYGGTGLGLAISQRLAEAQGGSITAESSGVIGEGSRFTLRIVAPEAPADAVTAAAPRTDVGPARAAVLGERHPLRILLAEDNAVNQKLALRLLQQQGYAAVVAANGLEVLEALEANVFDLVLMDVQMPELDGLETTRRIRRRWPGSGSPHIVAMTANAMAGDRELCLAAGMDGYVSKPIRVEELVAALETTPTRGERERADA
jgi:CheY-like chemotaxis protein